MQYQEIVDYIHSLPRMEGQPTLARMEAALARLRKPDCHYKIIHVAGTNGKGSTCAMLAGILTASGYRTGLFTSPYLDAFTNRIKIDGQDITEEDLEETFKLVRIPGQAEKLTQFEFITALALQYYALQKVDIVVLEVGLGGRFDATNAISSPLLTVITNIGYDHMAILGNTLAEIAAEKAGIIKPGVQLVTSVEDNEAWQVISDKCRDLGAPVSRLGQDYCISDTSADLNGQRFNFRDGRHQLDDLFISLLGSHQLKNAATALQAALHLRELGLDIGDADLRIGLGTAVWPGRFEVMSLSPLLIMDGSHNTHGMAALRDTLDQLLPDKHLRWVVGMMADKDIGGMLAYLEGRQTTIYACAPQIPRALEAAILTDTAQGHGFTAKAYGSVAEALGQALVDWQPGEVVLVAGSLYIISEARRSLSQK